MKAFPLDWEPTKRALPLGNGKLRNVDAGERSMRRNEITVWELSHRKVTVQNMWRAYVYAVGPLPPGVKTY